MEILPCVEIFAIVHHRIFDLEIAFFENNELIDIFCRIRLHMIPLELGVIRKSGKIKQIIFVFERMYEFIFVISPSKDNTIILKNFKVGRAKRDVAK